MKDDVNDGNKQSVPLYCYQCVAGPDLMRVEVEDGVAKRIVSNFDIAEEHPGGGRVCVKAYGLIQKTYNPHRIRQPMKRTNPNKGRNEDPRFVPISWREAFHIVGEKLREIRERGLVNEEGMPRVASTTGGGGIDWSLASLMNTYGMGTSIGVHVHKKRKTACVTTFF